MKLRCKNIINSKKFMSERGSSSVLVIMIMLLLITFGVLAMMSSYSNLKIARKHAQWTSEYYKLESLSEADLMRFETLYDEAIKETMRYFKDGLLNTSTVSDMPTAVKSSILEKFKEIDPGNLALENDLINRVFLYQLYNKYTADALYDRHYGSNFDENIVSTEVDLRWTPEISFITKDESTGRRLFIKISLVSNEALMLENPYEILQWREIPVEFEYEESIEYRDPEDN